MKIAILSMQRVINYGSVLQAYSLQQMIKKVTGELPEFIDIDETMSLKVPSDAHAVSRSKGKSPYSQKPLKKAKRIAFRLVSRMVDSQIKKFADKILEVNKSSEKYDLVVIGSDEVFNHGKGVNLQLHGDVKNADKVISYAASCGINSVEDIPKEALQDVQNALGRFSAISVRDKATVEYVRQLTGHETQRNLDPVLVGNLRKRKHSPVRLKRYMVIYAYNERIKEEEAKIIQKFAKSKGLKTLAIGGAQFWCDYYFPLTPLRVLDYFYYADYVVTDTFHGTIFSVINHKKFATIIRESNKNKMVSLLQDLHLEKRRVDNIEEIGAILQQGINYSKVDEFLDKAAKLSENYLREYI